MCLLCQTTSHTNSVSSKRTFIFSFFQWFLRTLPSPSSFLMRHTNEKRKRDPAEHQSSAHPPLLLFLFTRHHIKWATLPLPILEQRRGLMLAMTPGCQRQGHDNNGGLVDSMRDSKRISFSNPFFWLINMKLWFSTCSPEVQENCSLWRGSLTRAANLKAGRRRVKYGGETPIVWDLLHSSLCQPLSCYPSPAC